MKIIGLVCSLLLSITAFAEEKVPCGLTGTVDERIADCSPPPKPIFVLVTLTSRGHKVWKDTKTGVLWSEVFPHQMTNFDAEKTCASGSVPEIGGVPGKWILPTRSDFEAALQNDINSAFGFYDNLWTSDIVYFKQDNEAEQQEDPGDPGDFFWSYNFSGYNFGDSRGVRFLESHRSHSLGFLCISRP